MFELAIEPDDPFRVYSPGQTVRGHVILTVTKGFDITHLVLSLHGYAKVYKHQIPPGEGLPPVETLGNGKGSRGFEYHGNGLASLFQNEQILCGSGFLKKSVYKFAFEISFPSRNLPSTIDVGSAVPFSLSSDTNDTLVRTRDHLVLAHGHSYSSNDS